MRLIKKSFFILLLVFLVLPFSVQAEDLGMIPCGSAEKPCTFCDLLVLFQNIMNWGLSMLFVFALAGIIISGIVYMVSAGDPGLMEKAKGYFKICVIGILIVLGAWLLVNTVLLLMGANIRNTWSVVEGC